MKSRDDFEREYAERTGVSVEQLHKWGRYAVPCEGCDYPACEGWQMVNREDHLLHLIERGQAIPVVELAQTFGIASGSGPTIREVIEERTERTVRLCFESGRICYRLAEPA